MFAKFSCDNKIFLEYKSKRVVQVDKYLIILNTIYLV